MILALLCAVRCDVAIIAIEIRTLWAVIDCLDLLTKSTQTTELVLGFIDPQTDLNLVLLTILLLLLLRHFHVLFLIATNSRFTTVFWAIFGLPNWAVTVPVLLCLIQTV